MKTGQQTYDLTDIADSSFVRKWYARKDAFEIKKDDALGSTFAMVRYFDPFVGTGLGSQQMMDTFGWGNYSPGVSFMMQPLYDDLLRLQMIEFNDKVRKSQYGFDIQNNRVRVFPIPQYGDNNMKIHFHYVLESERNNPIVKSSVVSDYSNAKYDRIEYNKINHFFGKQWIAKYTLALAKEMLGAVRAKLSSIPIPNADITLDGADLRSEAASEKEILISELRENLEATHLKHYYKMHNK